MTTDDRQGGGDMANVSKKIPTNTQPTWQADINGKEYEYQSGITAEVPEEVAALIDDIEAGRAKEDPRASQRAIEDEVTQIVKDNFAGGVGYEETNEVVMLPETSFEYVAGNSNTIIKDSFPYTFEIGEEYKVTFDGETNTYTAVKSNGLIGIASSSIEEVFNGDGWFCEVNGGSLALSTMDASLIGDHSISISKTKSKHKIDNKYIDFKMDKTNPVGEGTFSLNRKEGSVIGKYSFSEGFGTAASGFVSHAEGGSTTASGKHSHAEGSITTASGDVSHAEGYNTTASGDESHAEGLQTIAASAAQHVQGKFNIEDSNNVYAHIIGGGNRDTRKNIHTVDWNGNAWYAGNVEGKALIIASSTAGSTKRFKVTVNDAGTLTATEVTS